MNMKFSELLSRAGIPFHVRGLDVDFSGDLASNSREVQTGDVFVALRGERSNGVEYAGQAQSRGALAVVCDAKDAGRIEDRMPVYAVTDLLSHRRDLLHAVYGETIRAMRWIGVTGTNGKTTTSWLTAQLLCSCGIPAAAVTTVGTRMPDGTVEAGTMTTPDPELIARHAAKARRAGAVAVVVEVSSHGIAQRRVDAFPFDVRVMTSFSQDHLDYHGSLESYAQAKAGFFLGAKGTHIMFDGAEPTRIVLGGGQRPLVYGVAGDAVLTQYAGTLEGSRFRFSLDGRQHDVKTGLPGRYNAYNVIASLLAARAAGADLDGAIRSAASVVPPPGRLQRANVPGVACFVDYAHTPDGVANVLSAMHELSPERVITVLGCGGDRDRSKRPMMARVAVEGSDLVVFTADNPRSEDPSAIIADMCKAFAPDAPGLLVGRKTTAWVSIPNRFEAIRFALRHARASDVVLIAGKGHEQTQQFRTRTVPFSDIAAAEQAARTRVRH